MTEFKLTVMLDCSPRLEGLLSAFVKASTVALTNTNKSDTQKATEKSALQVSPNEIEVQNTASAPEEKQNTNTSEKQEAEKPQTLEVQDCRKAYADCKTRLGISKTDAVMLQLLRDTASAELKRLGATAIANIAPDKRKDFIKFCETVELNNDPNLPF